MQGRQRGIFIGVSAISAVFLCLHLIGEVSRLESAREKLGKVFFFFYFSLHASLCLNSLEKYTTCIWNATCPAVRMFVTPTFFF